MGREVLFVYFYLMGSDPQRVRPIVPAHVKYWKDARLDDYRGGPFGDRSGGLIQFTAEDVGKAAEIVAGDPFVAAGLIETSWLKEWVPED